MTKEEKIICNHYLDDMDKTHTCNEYKLLKTLLNEQVPDVNNKALMAGMFILLFGVLVFGILLHISGIRDLQSGRYAEGLCDFIFGTGFIIISAIGAWELFLRGMFVKRRAKRSV